MSHSTQVHSYYLAHYINFKLSPSVYKCFIIKVNKHSDSSGLSEQPKLSENDSRF